MDEDLSRLIDAALLEGIIEAECLDCGMIIQCEPDAETAWCDYCGRVVKVKNALIDLGLI